MWPWRRGNNIHNFAFLKEKPDGSFRFILNLKNLNENINKIYFKMSILKLVTPLTYFTKIELKDAYYTIQCLLAIRNISDLQITKIYTNSHTYLMAIAMGPENSPKY